jgi:hypothetical protein
MRRLTPIIAVLALAAVASAQQNPRPRRLAVGPTTRVFGDAGQYAAFPGLVRTERQIILRFHNQDLEKLRAAKVTHPHFNPVNEEVWAVSTDDGQTWTTSTHAPKLDGTILDASYPKAVLPDGGLLDLTWRYEKGTTRREPFVQKIFRGDLSEPAETKREPTFDKVFIHGGHRLPGDGGILVAAYKGFSQLPTGLNIYKGTPDGADWKQIGQIPSSPPFNFNESALQAFPDGRVIVVMRNDWDKKQADGAGAPAEVNGNGTERKGYGYWLYQSESTDGGTTWSAPKQLPIWGHPPYLLRLKSGNLLMVYGHRREPHSVRAILSHDDGRTWDLDSMTTLHTFDPARIDHGYPIATQFDDGRVLVAYYGYTSDDVKLWDSPHGIFTTIVSEGD